MVQMWKKKYSSTFSSFLKSDLLGDEDPLRTFRPLFVEPVDGLDLPRLFMLG